MNDGETETTVCIDMDRIMKEIQIENWKTYSSSTLERFKRAVLSRVRDQTQVVEMVGDMPDVAAMVISAALAQRVVRFEYGGFKEPRFVIFDYSQQCPEMAL